MLWYLVLSVVGPVKLSRRAVVHQFTFRGIDVAGDHSCEFCDGPGGPLTFRHQACMAALCERAHGAVVHQFTFGGTDEVDVLI